MNKNWLILILVAMMVLEYKTGYKKVMFMPYDYKITYPTTIIKLEGRARGHKKYIDMRRVNKFYELKGEVK